MNRLLEDESEQELAPQAQQVREPLPQQRGDHPDGHGPEVHEVVGLVPKLDQPQ